MAYGVKEKKAFAREAINGWNPIEPTNSQNTKAWFMVEVSKFLAKELIDRDPLSIMTTDWDFSYTNENPNPNYISADDALARYRDAQRKTSASNRKAAVAAQDPNDGDMERINSTIETSEVYLTMYPYENRNSQWPTWND